MNLGFDWTLSDYVIALALLSGALLSAFLAWRMVKRTSHRLLLIVLALLFFLWLYVELAVGLFTNWGS